MQSSPLASSEAVRNVMRAVRRRDTKPEIRLRRALHALGLRFRVDMPIRVDGGRPVRPDIVFTKRRVAVFVDGCFWHRCPDHARQPKANREWWSEKLRRNVERDTADAARMRTSGWTVVRVWEHVGVDEAVGDVTRVLGVNGG